MITESDELAKAIDITLERMPEGSSRTDAMRALLEIATQGLRGEIDARVQRRRQALANLGNRFAGVWPANFREEELAQWPD